MLNCATSRMLGRHKYLLGQVLCCLSRSAEGGKGTSSGSYVRSYPILGIASWDPRGSRVLLRISHLLLSLRVAVRFNLHQLFAAHTTPQSLSNDTCERRQTRPCKSMATCGRFFKGTSGSVPHIDWEWCSPDSQVSSLNCLPLKSGCFPSLRTSRQTRDNAPVSCQGI